MARCSLDIVSVHVPPGVRASAARWSQPAGCKWSPRCWSGTGPKVRARRENWAFNWRDLVALHIVYLHIRLPGQSPIETHPPTCRSGTRQGERVLSAHLLPSRRP